MCEQLEPRALLTVFTVTSGATYGPGTLNAAINEANRHGGLDTIVFQMPGGGSQQIQPPREGFPKITGPVIIDGYTQPGSARNTSTDPAVNNAVVGARLISTGENTPLWIGPGGSFSQIRGLGFSNSGGYGPSGIRLDHTRFVTVDGDVFTAQGQSRLADAVTIVGGSNNTIGGDLAGTPALQNVMGIYDYGVDIQGRSTNNAVVGNIIGDTPRSSRAPMQKVGVRLQPGANNNTVVQNILYKNIQAYTDQGVGNLIINNTIIPQ
jgi:hypothetical protein